MKMKQASDVIKKLKPLVAAGVKHRHIASKLNAEGFTTRRGLKWRETNVSNFVHTYREAFNENELPVHVAVAAPASVPIQTSSKPALPAFIGRLLCDPELTDDEKMRMLRALYQHPS